MAGAATSPASAGAQAASSVHAATQGNAIASATWSAASSPPFDILGISLPALDVGALSLLTATGALLAFLIGCFTLIGRERKAPYIINSVFVIFLVALVGATVDVIAAALHGSRAGLLFLYAGLLLLIVSMALSVWRLYKVYVRFVLFVDSPHPKHWPAVRWVNSHVRALKTKRPYEHNPSTFSADALEKAVTILTAEDRFATKRKDSFVASAAVAVQDQAESDQLLADLALLFLDQGYLLQYMAASRHPIHFIEHLKSVALSRKNDWQKLARCIVAVDAYTSHFGFTDSIYYKEARRLRVELNVEYLTSGPSYAGLHSASSEAFNVLRQKTSIPNDNVRQPVLVVYEDCSALADLESSEQYRVFVRHVMPSERMWGGMFTLFIETSPSKADWSLLAAYANVAVRAKSLEK